MYQKQTEIEVEDARAMLDFPVVKQEVQTVIDDCKTITVPNKLAIVRPDTQQVLSVMSEKYTLLPHKVMLDEAISHLEDAGFDYRINKCELLNNGGRAVVGFTLKELTHQFGDGDTLDYQLYFKNSYDGSWAFDFTSGFFRLVCSNGLMVGEVADRIHRKHSSRFHINPIVDQITEYVNRSKALGIDNFMKMKQSKISISRGIELIGQSIEEKIWPKKYKEVVEDNFVNRRDSISNDSIYDVYNAYTRELRDMRSHSDKKDDVSFMRVNTLGNDVFSYYRNQIVA